MAYASITHVAFLNFARSGTRGYDATSVPNGSQVAIFLEQIAAEVDLKLRTAGYFLPVATGATSTLKLMEDVNAKGAAWMVEVAAPTSDNVDEYFQMYQTALGNLCEGELDAAIDTRRGLPRGFFGNNLGQGDPIIGLPPGASTMRDR